MTSNDIIPSPEVHALKQKCQMLVDELATLLAEQEHLVNTVGPNLIAIYATTIGVKEYEALCLDVEVRRLKTTIEKIQAVENQGKKPNLEQIEAAVEEELKTWKNKVDKMLGEIKAGQERLKNQMSSEDSTELLKLYRSLAKKLHPDLNPGLTEKHKMLWGRVQQAYASGNLPELRVLALMVEDMPEEMQVPNQLELLEKRYGELKIQVDGMMQKISYIQNYPPHTLTDKLNDPDWVQGQIGECGKRIEALTTEKKSLEEWLSLWKDKK